jgi:DNA-binding GntR family transcriptional regulator
MAARSGAAKAPGQEIAAAQPVGDRVFEILREDILTLNLPPGTHLTEAFLSQRFGISVTPIREALHRLIHSGYAVRQTARGVKVRQLEAREVQDVYELRHVLEPVALAQSIPNLTAADLKRIERTLVQARKAMDQEDLKNAAVHNSQFHARLVAAAPNRMLTSWLDSLRDWQRLITLQEWSLEDRSAAEFEEHWAILERAKARDVAGAVMLLSRHIGHFVAQGT